MGCLVLTIWAVGLLGCSTFGSGPVAYLPYFLLLISAGEAPGLCTEQGPERHLHTPTSGIVFSLLLSISRLPTVMETASALNLVAQPQAEVPAARLGCFHWVFFSVWFASLQHHSLPALPCQLCAHCRARMLGYALNTLRK